MAEAEGVLPDLWTACKQPEDTAAACLASSPTAEQLVDCLEDYLATTYQTTMTKVSPEDQQRLCLFLLSCSGLKLDVAIASPTTKEHVEASMATCFLLRDLELAKQRVTLSAAADEDKVGPSYNSLIGFAKPKFDGCTCKFDLFQLCTLRGLPFADALKCMSSTSNDHSEQHW